jgi:hypothetical protein
VSSSNEISIAGPKAMPPSTAGKWRWVEPVEAIILTILAAIVAGTAIVVAYRSLSPLPLFDQWEYLDPSYIWHGLFAVHGEHRIVISKLAFFADMSFFGGENIADYAVTLIMLLAIGALYWAAVGLDRSATWTHRALAAGMVLCFTTSPLTIGVLLWGMHVQNVGVNLFAGAAFFLLALSARKGPAAPARYLILSLAIASGVVATFTSANGLLVPFLLIAEAAVLRLRGREIAWIAIAAVIAAALFLHGNTAQGNATRTITTAPLGVAKFFFLFLGCIVPQAVTLSDAVTLQPLVFAIGFASVALLALNTLVYLRRHRSKGPDPLAIFCLVFSLFFLCSAALVSAGRYPYGFGHAYTEHYNILRVLYWANLLLSIGACWNTPRAWQLVGALAICAAVVVCTEIPSRITGLKYRDAALNNAAAAIATEVYDFGPWRTVNIWNESNPSTYPFMKAQTELLREHHWSVFHDAPAAWTRLNIHTLPLANSSCPGAITQSQLHSDPEGKFQSVLGWIDHPITTNTAPEIVLTDAPGNIIGFASFVVSPNPPQQWAGYARSQYPPAKAYFFNDGTLCPLTDNR